MKTARVQMLLDKGLIEKIDDYRFSKRIGSQAAAIRQLIEKGLEASASAKASEASAGQQA